ncbi:DNA cytosine methyltransferase [Brucella sp.]|uniref:DNA cytosine methyltransferase n=1 Tax=Brucella sp. TaxID=52132 RepID=UPI0028AFFBCE|nr:DNA cytosine methyltransferase [Brucella sp.]
MTKKFLVADLLCGAGGSSTGAAYAFRDLGMEMELVCVNHWPLAIETHQLNHPNARHFVQDIATVRPHLLVPEGYLDLLMASPTCTHHSNARGGKPTSDQQRSDPWHIITWLTELNVKRIIIENVWEFISWGPVDPETGRPIPSRKGEYFHAWIETLKRLGFEPEWRKLNAADYGDATTRQRFILMARSDGKKVRWPMPSHKKTAKSEQGLFSVEQNWRPASEIIDWSIKGRSIFNRKKPLAAKTLSRIYAGAIKHHWPEPFIVVLRNHMTAQGIDVPLPTIAASGTHIAIAEPVVVNMKGQSTASSTNNPLPTQTAHAPHLYVGEAVVLSQSTGGAARPASEPLPTILTGGAGADRPGCARPMLVEPFVLSQATCGAPRSVSNPLPTSTTGGNGGSHALISPYYGSGSGETCTPPSQPLPTITSKGRFGMVVPVTQSSGGASPRVLAEPLPTLTTAKGGEFAVVLPVTHEGGLQRFLNPSDDPLPTITGAIRGELAFVTAQHGERAGQAPRVHSLGNPVPTITASGHVDLVEPEHNAGGVDILFRMLEPHELAGAMGLDDYKFAGNKTQKIKQIGNAVSRRKMQACVAAIMADDAPSGSDVGRSSYLEAAE